MQAAAGTMNILQETGIINVTIKTQTPVSTGRLHVTSSLRQTAAVLRHPPQSHSARFCLNRPHLSSLSPLLPGGSCIRPAALIISMAPLPSELCTAREIFLEDYLRTSPSSSIIWGRRHAARLLTSRTNAEKLFTGHGRGCDFCCHYYGIHNSINN